MLEMWTNINHGISIQCFALCQNGKWSWAFLLFHFLSDNVFRRFLPVPMLLHGNRCGKMNERSKLWSTLQGHWILSMIPLPSGHWHTSFCSRFESLCMHNWILMCRWRTMCVARSYLVISPVRESFPLCFWTWDSFFYSLFDDASCRIQPLFRDLKSQPLLVFAVFLRSWTFYCGVEALEDWK